ncbi:MAG TPA: c-type cytochrome biogenesis protein CcmI [Casimicrobiaceae bacterium]|nr:c-type cytochrome biogenesis protein CcmI [Casimicrobiaceae bacterium]
MPSAALFWLVALLLAAGTVAALVWPLLRARPQTSVQDEAVATDVYRDQKRQLDDELAAGAITRAERDAQLDELAARLSAEIASAPEAVSRGSPRTSYIAALILVAAIPATALVLYATFGDPGIFREQALASERQKMSAQEVVALVDKLAARMKAHPEDPTGWRLLARSYAAFGKFPEAVAAFKEAAARGPADASLLADWADALAMQNRSLEGEPSQLVERALAIDPAQPKALSLAATAALERKDYDRAIDEWRKLEVQMPPGSDAAKDIDTMIAEAGAARRGTPMPSLGAPAEASSVSAPGAQPNDDAKAQASAITGRVSLAPVLRDRVAANDTLFIFARAANGPRMPLAVVRANASELPREFRLDDSMAMTPAARLSAAKGIIVQARISKSGSATPSPGDLRGTSGIVAPGTHGVSIVIDDVVK